MRSPTMGHLTHEGVTYVLTRSVEHIGTVWEVTDKTDASRGCLFRFRTLKLNAARSLLRHALTRKDDE